MPKAAAESKSTPEAYILASIGGFIDAVGVLTLGGLFVAHMSGNTAVLGAAFGQGNWSVGWLHLFAIPIFVLGLFLGYLGIQTSPTMRRCGQLLLLEALLLAIFAISRTTLGRPPLDSLTYFAIVTPPLLAMGMQNALLRDIGRSAFASTYVTGVLDMLAKSFATFVARGRDPKYRTLTLRAFGIWSCYVFGALAGSAGLLFFKDPVLFLPPVVLIVLGLRFLTAKDEL